MTKSLFNLEWISRLEQFNKLFVGLSGGLDSTVLLHAIASIPSLRTKTYAAHVNHQLSSNADYWQKHCFDFCLNLGIAIKTQNVEFDRCANKEEGARNARYEFLSSLLTRNDCLLTAHHLDDQAETLLLQLFRGAGVQGLAAMGEIGILGEGCIARPFLSHSRKQLEEYARDHQLHWVDDESNQDINYSRNFLRHQIMPLLSSKWPGVTGNLARTALHCQQAATNLEDLALLDSPELENTLWIKPLKTLSMPRIINVLRVWLKKNQIRLPSSLTLQRLIDEMIGASPDAQPVVQWAKIKICRYQEHLYIIKADAALQSCTEWSNFPSPLILANNGVLHASQVSQGLVIPKDTKLAIKYRQGGELLFWHGQNKQLKKLFQEWGIPPWLRERIPLLFINEQLVAVVGYAVSDLFYSQNSSEAWQLSITQAR